MIHIDVHSISAIKSIPVGKSAFFFSEGKPKRTFLGITLVSGYPRGWYQRQFDDLCFDYSTYYPVDSSTTPPTKLLEDNTHLMFDGVSVLKKAHLVITLQNKDDYHEYYGSDAKAAARISELQAMSKSLLTPLK